MMPPAPLPALAAECARLSLALNTITAWETPTRCTPWDAAALTAHITMTIARLGPMLDAPEPVAATVDAAGYYRPDERFSSEVNDIRIDAAAEAAKAGGPAVAAEFKAVWATAVDRCAAEPAGRLVTTRHGDPMTLHDFLTTRVVEVAVHGIDLADALGRPRWTTPEAAAHVTTLLLGHEQPPAGLDPVAFIAKATGRDDFTEAERAAIEALEITWLALG